MLKGEIYYTQLAPKNIWYLCQKTFGSICRLKTSLPKYKLYSKKPSIIHETEEQKACDYDHIDNMYEKCGRFNTLPGRQT